MPHLQQHDEKADLSSLFLGAYGENNDLLEKILLELARIDRQVRTKS